MTGREGGRLSAGEWRVMHALWAASEARGRATAREVLDALPPGTTWAYSTLKTMLDRLAEKRVVKRERRPLVVQYAPRLAREAAERREVDALTDDVFGGRTAPLVHFLIANERLTKRDREELRRLLSQEDAVPPEQEPRA